MFSSPAQSLSLHQKWVLNVLWCGTLDIAKEFVQITQHHTQHLAVSVLRLARFLAETDLAALRMTAGECGTRPNSRGRLQQT
jgi:hypothetical protein